MATGEKGGRTRCVTCGKDNKATFTCRGCLQDFCFNHLTDHQQELSQQLDDIEVIHDLFRQTLIQHTQQPHKHPSIQQINDWEYKSIRKIRETAEEIRQILLQHTNGHIKQIEVDLNKLTDKLRESRKNNDFFETDLRHWNEELNRLTEELVQPSSICLQEESTPLINKVSIYVSTSTPMGHILNIASDAKWMQNGITVAGNNLQGDKANQLHYPLGLSVDDNQVIYIVDQYNHRIVEWNIGARSGRIVAGGNGTGNQTKQLSYPKDVILGKETNSLIISDCGNRRVMRWSRENSIRGEVIISDVGCYGLAIDNHGYLFVSDYGKHEVARWKIGDTHGTVVAGGNGQGNRLDQLHHPTYIFVDQEHSVYVSDTDNDRVMKWTKGAKEGMIVAGGQGPGNSLNQLKKPYGLVVDQLGTIYVADYGNYRVMRWSKGATQGETIIGGHETGEKTNQLSGPVGLSFDRQGNLYVVDQLNQRVQKFDIESNSNT